VISRSYLQARAANSVLSLFLVTIFPVTISTLSSPLSFVGPFAIVPVRVGVTDIHACPNTSDMCAGIYTPFSNTNACPNASNIDAHPKAGEDYSSVCAVINSVCIAGDTEGKHCGKSYSKKVYTCDSLHFISFLPIMIGI
jgi:hypothetical protein